MLNSPAVGLIAVALATTVTILAPLDAIADDKSILQTPPKSIDNPTNASEALELLKSYKPSNYDRQFYWDLPLHAESSVIKTLRDSGDDAEADRLLEAARKVVIDTYGIKSPAYSAFLAFECSDLMKRKKIDQGLAKLNEALALGPKTLGVGEPISAYSIVLLSIKMMLREDPLVGEKMLKRMMASYFHALQQDMPRLANLPLRSVQWDTSRSARPLENQNPSEFTRIQRMYFGSADAPRFTQFDIYFNVEEALSRDRLTGEKRIPDFSDFATLYDNATKPEPYNPRAAAIAEAFMKYCDEHENWVFVLEYAERRVEIMRRSPDVGRRESSDVGGMSRSTVFKMAFKAAGKLHDKETQRHWLELAIDTMVAPTPDEMLTLAMMANEVGQIELANKLANHVDSNDLLFPGKTPRLASIWRELGKPDKATAVDARTPTP